MTISKLIELLKTHGGDGSGLAFFAYRDECGGEECRVSIEFIEPLIDKDGNVPGLDLRGNQ